MPVGNVGQRCSQCVKEGVVPARPATNSGLCHPHWRRAMSFPHAAAIEEGDNDTIIDRYLGAANSGTTRFEAMKMAGHAWDSDAPEFEAKLREMLG